VNNGITQQSETYTLDLRINHGNSGGPLFSTDDGSVLGIIVEISPTTIENGVAFAVPAKYIAVLLDKSKIPWVSVGEKRKKADPEGSAR
jgi:S1-C subfamily serine protease